MALSLGVASCSSGDADSTAAADLPVETTVAANDEIALADAPSFDVEFSVRGGLGELAQLDADADHSITIEMIDYNEAAAAVGATPLGSDASGEDVFTWIGSVGFGDSVADGGTGLSLTPPRLIGDADLSRPESVVEEFGWSFGAIDRFTEVSIGSDGRFTTLVGDLAWADGLAEVAPGVSTIGEGPDGEVNDAARTDLRRLGRPVRVGERGDFIAASLATAPVGAWAQGTHQAYTSNDELFAAAESLDANGVFQATLLKAPFGIDRLLPPDADDLEQITDAAVDQPFSTVGIGLAATDDGVGHVIVYVFATDDDAAAATRQLAEVWTTGASIVGGPDFHELLGEPTITQRGQTVVVTGALPDTGSATDIINMVFRSDLPFIHG